MGLEDRSFCCNMDMDIPEYKDIKILKCLVTLSIHPLYPDREYYEEECKASHDSIEEEDQGQKTEEHRTSCHG